MVTTPTHQHFGTFPMSNFVRDLARGKEGELFLLEQFPSLVRTDGRKFDFTTSAGVPLEVKFDFLKYPNIFLEIISNSNKESPGAIWQSLLNGVEYFVYVFKHDSSVRIYRVSELCWYLFKTHGKYSIKKVRNKTYYTHGYAIPIADLTHLELPHEVLK